MFVKCFTRTILQYVLKGSGGWKYNNYFPVAEGEGKINNMHNPGMPESSNYQWQTVRYENILTS